MFHDQDACAEKLDFIAVHPFINIVKFNGQLPV